MSVSHVYTLSLQHSFQISHISIQKVIIENFINTLCITTKSSQTSWHLIYHLHITKLFCFLNQNTMLIIDNKTLTSIIHSFHHQKSIHTSLTIFSIPNNTVTLTQNQFFPVHSKLYYFEQNTIEGNKLRQHYSLVNTEFTSFPYNSVSRRSVNCPFIPTSNSVIPHINLLEDLPQSYKIRICNLKSEYHSQHNSIG